MTDALLQAYTVPADPAEEILVTSMLKKGSDTETDQLGTPLESCTVSGIAAPAYFRGRIAGGSHWATWHVTGEPALLVQIKPRRPRKKRDDPDPEVPVAAPPVFVVLPRGTATVLRLLNPTCNFLVQTSRETVYPTTVLEGVLTVRRKVLDGNVAYERARLQTLRSLTQHEPLKAGAGANPTMHDHSLVFLARECLWWRTPRARSDDFQTRMVTARSLVEGEPGQKPVAQFTEPGLVLAYQPHMAPPQALVVTRDVPGPLVGTDLAGIELRPTDPTAHAAMLVAGDADTYAHVAQTLWDAEVR